MTEPSSPVTQAAVPALYLWAVTLLPVMASNGPPMQRIMALTPILVTGAALAWERQGGRLALHALLWGNTLAISASLLTLSAKAMHEFGLFRGVLAISGWVLFAYTCAAPALEISGRIAPFEVRRVGIFALPLLALAFLGFGFDMVDAERSVFIHVAACLLGLFVLAQVRVTSWLRGVMAAVAITLALTTLLLFRMSRDMEGVAAGLACILSMGLGERIERRLARGPMLTAKAQTPANRL